MPKYGISSKCGTDRASYDDSIRASNNKGDLYYYNLNPPNLAEVLAARRASKRNSRRRESAGSAAMEGQAPLSGSAGGGIGGSSGAPATNRP